MSGQKLGGSKKFDYISRYCCNSKVANIHKAIGPSPPSREKYGAFYKNSRHKMLLESICVSKDNHSYIIM